MNEVISNPLLDKFMKDLIVQILSMISEQEEMKVNVDKHKGIQVAKTKEYIRGDLYSIHRMRKILRNVSLSSCSRNVRRMPSN